MIEEIRKDIDVLTEAKTLENKFVTVADLIRRLQKLDPKLEIRIADGSHTRKPRLNDIRVVEILDKKFIVV